MTPNDITITVPVSALESAARERIAELTRERDEALEARATYEDLAKKAEERSAFFAARSDDARAALAQAKEQAHAWQREARGWEADRHAVARDRGEARAALALCEKEREDARQELVAARVRIDELEAALRKALRERDLAREGADVANMQRDDAKRQADELASQLDTARAHLKSAQIEAGALRGALETDRIGGRVATDFLNARIRVLEDAIRTMAKVLP